jgi:hypothetical protein
MSVPIPPCLWSAQSDSLILSSQLVKEQCPTNHPPLQEALVGRHSSQDGRRRDKWCRQERPHMHLGGSGMYDEMGLQSKTHYIHVRLLTQLRSYQISPKLSSLKPLHKFRGYKRNYFSPLKFCLLWEHCVLRI